jgi:hypothetical protein
MNPMTQKQALCALLMAPILLASATQAQSPYRVDYFANANTAGDTDATLRLDNDGSAAALNLCADIFVFDANEELSECCACLQTPDGLTTLSVNLDLTANPGNGVILTSGVLKIVAAFAPAPTCPVPYQILLVPDGEIQSWATHTQNIGTVTEGASQVSHLSSTEEKELAQSCGAIEAIGSGAGICSCGP